jgi:hypothetical protein
MSRTINFVRERQRNLTRMEQQDRVSFRWACIVLAAVVGIVVMAVGVRLFFLYKLQAVTDEQKNLRQAIVAQEEVEKSFTVFAFKLKTLTDLFGKRKEKQETLEYFSTLFDQDVVIRQLSYSSTSEELSFTLESKSVFVLEHVMEVMQSDEIKQRYPTIKKESLTRSSDGSYGMFVSILLGERKIDAPADGLPIEDGTINDVAPATP